MTVKCEKCNKLYDDVYRLTYCPHEKFQMRTIVAGPEGVRGIATTVEECRKLMESPNPESVKEDGCQPSAK